MGDEGENYARVCVLCSPFTLRVRRTSTHPPGSKHCCSAMGPPPHLLQHPLRARATKAPRRSLCTLWPAKVLIAEIALALCECGREIVFCLNARRGLFRANLSRRRSCLICAHLCNAAANLFMYQKDFSH